MRRGADLLVNSRFTIFVARTTWMWLRTNFFLPCHSFETDINRANGLFVRMIYILVSYEGLSMMRLIGKQAKTTEQERNVVIERHVKVGAPRRKFEGESICS